MKSFMLVYNTEYAPYLSPVIDRKKKNTKYWS
jgi:hypothetical protein